MATNACAKAPEHHASVEAVQGALAELSAGRREFEVFLTELFDHCRDAQEQCALLERERAMLQAQLEAARRHNAKLAETLAGQQHRGIREHTRWGGELKRLRRLLENIAEQLPRERKPVTVHRSETKEREPQIDADERS